jgi:hypothetical protein
MSALADRLTLSIRAAKLGIKVRTHFVYPPIPIRNFDWSAVDDNTYDGAPDSHCPVGYGCTEDAAIESLLDQLEDAQ